MAARSRAGGAGRGGRRRPSRGSDAPLRLELGGVLAPPLAARHGIGREELRGPLSALRGLLPALLAPGAPSGFARVVRRGSVLRGVLEEARRWRRRGVRDLVHVGIGGSSLGAEALLRALGHPFRDLLPDARRGGPRVHFVDNVDPERIGALLEVVDPRRALVHVVSKSGGTVETAAGFQVIREALEKARVRWQERCVFTTGRGALRALAAREDVPTLPFPEDVGGRFSVLTASGLFTPAVAGVDVAGVVAGARGQLARSARAAPDACAPLVHAAVLHRLAERGKAIHVLMPYGDALEPLARWYVQLTGESLGKPDPRGGRRGGVGVTPLPARGTTDQHSQVQLFVQGPADKLVTFVAVEETPARRMPGGAPAEYLEGVDLGDLLRAELRGTEVALAQAGRPSTTWVLPRLAPAPLGALFLSLELQIAAQAELLGIDAYDQPGVEAGKVAAFALIGRRGYERERARIGRDAPPRWTI